MSELIDRIKKFGHWRVNYRPKVMASLSLAQCSSLVIENSVRIRGWDFPHISHGRAGELKNLGSYVEDTCDWERHIEFWRMYKSSQFLAYKVLWEDVPPFEGVRRPKTAAFSIGSAVYSVVEYVEFAYKLHQSGLYQDGLSIFIEIRNNSDRQLWVNDPMRMDFSNPRRSHASTISIERTLGGAALDSAERASFAASILVELFDNFGWDVSVDKMLSDIEKAYKRSL